MDYTAAREKFERGEVEVTLERVEKSAPDSGRVDQKERNILILIIITNYKSQLGQEFLGETKKMFNMIEEKPFISVILTAFKRREFILDAIQSIEKQTLHKEKYEVIIAKDFSDQILDKKIEALGYKSFIYGGRVGEQLALCLQNATGEVVSFLQDDDVFEKDKLKQVFNAFDSNDRLIFMRNGFSIINSTGFFVDTHNFYRTTTNMLIHDDVKRETKNISLMIKQNFDFNLSCISIKRSIVLKYIDTLKEIETGDDSFMFFVSMFEVGDLLRVTAPLNRYRVHNNGTTLKTGPIDIMLKKNASEFLKQIRTFERLRKLSNDRYIYNALDEGILLRMASYRIVNIIDTDYHVKLSEVLKMLNHHETIATGFIAKLFFANFLTTLNKSFGARVYYNYIVTRYKHIN